MSYTPTIAEFKTFFVRDFPFAPASDPADAENYIIDADITRAISEAEINFNAQYGTDDQCKIVFMYLIAFYLVTNIQNSTRGLNAQAKFPMNSNSVGGVSVSYQIPDKIAKDMFLSQYTQNGYGMKYLSLVAPFLIGGVSLIEGTTTFD